jgi:hypothetical protein
MPGLLTWAAFQRKCEQCSIPGDATAQAWRVYKKECPLDELGVDDILSFFVCPKEAGSARGPCDPALAVACVQPECCNDSTNPDRCGPDIEQARC